MKLNDDGTAILLVDEDGREPTEAELSILVSVLTAMPFVELRWHERAQPGEPSVTDYAGYLVKHLRSRYLQDLRQDLS